MIYDTLAHEDFQRVYRRAFWRKLNSWLGGKNNQLLAYDDIRNNLPFLGQRDIGLQEVPVSKIVGSVGRYRDFDRAFLPTQKATSNRWISISKARYQDIELPPVELYKLGEVYFVKDGNHRVSVARDREQIYIDAYVTEIDVPISLTEDMVLDDVVALKGYAEFAQAANLKKLLPDADLRLSLTNEYGRLLNHIQTHRYFLSQELGREATMDEAVVSWYTTVYLPLVNAIRERKLESQLPQYTVTDLYLVVSEYLWLLKEEMEGHSAIEETIKELTTVYDEANVRRTLRTLQQLNWLEELIITQERERFFRRTELLQSRPSASIVLSLPGKYENMLRHINVHRYYMGEERDEEVSLPEAAANFYDTVYLPLLDLIKDQDLLIDFPARTEADLCLWVLDHRLDLVEALDSLPRGAESDSLDEEE